MKATENTKLRDYYMAMYPTDALGERINEETTFGDLEDCINQKGCVYDLFGVGDSIIRERLFKALADIMGCSYNYLYMKWVG